MQSNYILQNGSITRTEGEPGNIIVIVAPTEAEKKALREDLGIDPHTLESALDPDEPSRMEMEDEYVALIWKRPKNASLEQQFQFGVSSAGVFLAHDKAIIVSPDTDFHLTGKEFRNVQTTQDLVLRLLLHSVHHYQGHLKVVKLVVSEVQKKLNTSMENRYFLQMFALSESLIYYLDALESNAMLIQKLQRSAKRLGMSEQETELLDDILIEQNQCNRQAAIHSEVLSGLMDARGNIVNNNMNALLKNLTFINVVFLPLNLLASIGGMSEYTTLTSFMNPYLAYLMFLLIMAALAKVTWVVLSRVVDHTDTGRHDS